MYLSVIIPAYNEGHRIAKTLIELNKYLHKQSFSYEIIVVNDGSEDNTAYVVKKLSIENLRIIDNKKNHGKGYAVRIGMLEAKGDYRLFMDADNSTSIREIEKFLVFLSEYDIIIGSRAMKDSKITKSQSYYRRILGKLYGLLTRLIIGLWDFKDMQCGFKLLNAKASEHILPKCVVDGFSFDSEILIIAKNLKYKIKEVPISWENDSQTKVGFKEMVKMLFNLFKIRWNLFTQKYK